MNWWRDAVIYQVYPRSFADSDGDGIGDLLGLVDKLDYLANTLGVDAIWLCPVYPSPQIDFGYDISDHTAIDPVFGTDADFAELITAAHARGLKLIIDFVPNHTSDQHPWFQESRAGKDNPKRDWYVWADPRPDGTPPSNWTSEQGGSTWEFDQATGQYYLHSFHRTQPDVNWRNPELRAAMLKVLRHWLDRGVDGFRIDVLHLIAKDPAFTDNPPRPLPAPNGTDLQHPDYDTQWHLHDRLHPDLDGYITEIRALLDEYTARTGQERIAIGEVEAMPWTAATRFLGAQLNGVHFTFNFDFLETRWHAKALRAAIGAQEAALPPDAWPNYVLSNHDRPRLPTRLGPEHTRVAALLLLTLRGTPTLYYGEELGLSDLPIPRERWQDPLGRDQVRGPMPWTSTEHTTWLPANAHYLANTVESQLADPHSTLTLYCRLLALRRANPALHRGDYQALAGLPEHCLAYLRGTPAHTLAVLLNLGPDPATITLPRPGNALLSTSGTAPDGTRSEFQVPAHAGLIVALTRR
ncbi:alpha-amylase family glycosyl hydrolase [Crossiella sp. CA198]|uniref:alpha-amylase family glycosyl hydrolase n=1 Tax=Crossiella sp. CA198 TaxID=3455607 RepID=UPI003F8D4285